MLVNSSGNFSSINPGQFRVCFYSNSNVAIDSELHSIGTCLESKSAILLSFPAICSSVKSYACNNANQRAKRPVRFFGLLINQVSAEQSVLKKTWHVSNMVRNVTMN